jgi:ADP-ribose pyrophosphatase YjhB (NUDIX family)
MTPVAVTTDLLHDLVAGSHAEGVTALAVACTVDHDGRILLLVEPGLDFIDNDTWHLPTGPVLPGETLTDALPKALAAIGLIIDEVTGYLGHHDRDDTRVFCFAVTVTDPDSVCRSAHIGHRWADLDDLPDPPAPAAHPAPRAAATRHEPEEPPLALAGALRAHARGLHAAEAGTELLICHATWLHRSDFRDRFVHTGTGITGATELARIDWAAAITALDAGELPCSGGEGRMLRLAASLVDGIPVDLRDALTSLDTRNTDLVSRAVPHANGRRP